jgi:NADH-quinone oxidoreductase subunit F
VLGWTRFYEHESCGKCTPCREGGYWLSQILNRLETGNGRIEDLDLLEDLCDNIFGRSFCALGDGMTSPIVAGLKHFRDEFEAHVRERRCPLGATPPDHELPVLEVHGGAGYSPFVLPATTETPARAGTTDASIAPAGQA